MADIDRRTGAIIDNYASACQAVEIIFTTRLGEVVMLREFGGGVVEMLGRLMVPSLFAAFQQLIGTAIDLWEPRFRVRAVRINGSAEQLRSGEAGISIEVDWRPRAHRGDFRVEGVRSLIVGFAGQQVRVA